MRHFKYILVVLLLPFTLNVISANLPQFKAANDLYAAGKYEEAIKKYESLIAEDQLSADIYFNLGNAYYKDEQMPQAILNYERALKLKPDHEDAMFNLKMANQNTIDKIDRLPELFIANSWRTLVTSKTVNTWAYFTVGLLFLALSFYIIYLITNPVMIKKISFYSGSFFVLVALFCWLMAAQHQSINAAASEAIIFEPTTTILSAPNNNAEKLFTLHEGTKVILIETQEDWSKIKLPNGNIGWIKANAIVSI